MHSYYQGKFKPKNPKKYKGNLDGIWFRSSWEMRCFNWLDTSEDVLSWSSEEVVIPYISPLDQKFHRYYPDIWARMKTKAGIKEFLIEVKPYNQTIAPEPKKRKTKKYINEITTYSVNDAKWKAAREYCLDKGWTFKVLTEKDIFLFVK